MAKLSWNEIRQRAIQFSREWTGEHRERAEAQTFWNEFFEVFGIRRRLSPPQACFRQDEAIASEFVLESLLIKGVYSYADVGFQG